jgi:glucuronate isomerase
MTQAAAGAIRAHVNDTPAIDVHSHQGTNGIWQAGNLWELFSYHWLATDIRCAGCPPEVFTAREMEPRERMRQAVAYSSAARNTVNHWCFMHMAHDLYGFPHPCVDATNWEWLWDAVAERAGDAAWEATVLKRANVPLASAAFHDPARLPLNYFTYEYGEYMYCPVGQDPGRHQLRRLGEDISGADDLQLAIRERIRGLVERESIRALHVWAPLTWTYCPVEPRQAEVLLHKAQAAAHLQPSERDQLVSFTADCTAAACGELGVVLQLFCGSLALEPSGPNVSIYRPEWLRALVPFLSKHASTNVDLFLASRPLSHEAAVLSRNYPNLWVSGAWWQGFTPSTLTEFFRDRLEMLPMNKWNAFYSDAYCVEWIYGKVSLTRNRLAAALTAMVDEELISLDTAYDMATAVLHDNARRLYRL